MSNATSGRLSEVSCTNCGASVWLEDEDAEPDACRECCDHPKTQTEGFYEVCLVCGDSSDGYEF